MTAGPVNPAKSIDRAAALLATDPSGAGREAEGLLRVDPRDPRAALILASARRRLGDPRAALAILIPLAKAFPKAANTQYELGVALAEIGDTAKAVSALRQAVGLNRDLPEAWRALGDLLFRDGQAAAAESAFAEHRRAAITDPDLKPAAEALYRGDLTTAEKLAREFLLAHLDDAAGTRLLADIYARQSRHGDAELLFARSLELDPDHDGARFSYADALFKQQKANQALTQVEALVKRAPRDPASLNLLAACLALVGEDGRVIGIFEDLLKDYPRQPRLWLNYGHTLRAVGRRDDAVAAYKRCLELAPDLGDAYWSLANLKVASFTEDQEATMHAALGRPDLSVDDRLHMHYALGKALEDRKDFAASFRHYAEGAKLRRTETPYDADNTSALTRRSMALFTSQFLDERADLGASEDDPIFIVGLPRSGSTLVEQILASHSQVEGTMELADIGLIARSLGSDYPEGLASLDSAALKSIGEGYIETTRINRKLGRRYFIDKMPNNFQHVGLIRLILPRARIIDARRHPMGSCFSAFKQHFAQGQSFSYDLTDLGRYYSDYVELMAHFDAVAPGAIHRVLYEDMVTETEREVHRLLDYCGLPFEESCLKFYENDRTVRTVSSEQVRQPIYRGGLDQWRAYEPWLDPLKQALGPVLETWRN